MIAVEKSTRGFWLLLSISIFVLITGVFAIYFSRANDFCNANNTGISFGLLEGSGVLVTVLAALMLLVLFFLLIRQLRDLHRGNERNSCNCIVYIGLLVGGGLNLAERIVLGDICDYISVNINILGISRLNFNFADILIVGSIMYGIYLIVKYKESNE